jgi:WD40 repeat protein
LWDVTTGENIATFWSHSSDIQSLAFSPDGTLLASGSFDGTILLWNMKPYLSPY